MLHEPFLVLHVVAAALLIGGGLLLAASGYGLLALDRGRELVPWTVLAMVSAPMTVASGVALFATGGHLAATAWSFSEGWITISTIALTVLGVATLVIYRRLWTLVGEVRGLGEERVDDDLRARLASPVIWAVAHALVLSGPAFIVVMVLKTPFLTTGLWLGGAAVLGVASGIAFSRRARGAGLAAGAAAR